MATKIAMTSDKFKATYPLISQPGTYSLSVRSVSNSQFTNEVTGKQYRIVNLRGLFPQHVSPELLNDINDGNVDIMAVKGISFNYTGTDVPAQNETVRVTVGFVTSKGKANGTGEETQVLAVVAMSVPTAVVPTSSGWNTLLKAESVIETVLEPEDAEVDI